jgi:hypothetical protein
MLPKIINMTQHHATPEQKAVGVVDLPEHMREEVSQVITFDEIPSPKEMTVRAQQVVAIFRRGQDAISQEGMIQVGITAMIGGAPYFMASLERILMADGIEPVYAFSRRESEDQTQPDGSVKKVAVFRHAGFVKVY